MTAGHECWVDAYVIEEARRDLAVKAPDTLADLEAHLLRMHVAGYQPPKPGLARVALPQKDLPVLAAAIRCSCAALVTGDRAHFGALFGKTIQGVTIHSPRSLAEALLS
jgi:hypothetical protein